MYPNRVSLEVLNVDYLLREMDFNCSSSCAFLVLSIILRLGRFYSTHVCVLQSPESPSSPALLFPVMIACLAIPCHWPSHNRFINIASWAICRFWFPGTRLGTFDGRHCIRKWFTLPPSQSHWPFELRAVLILSVWRFFAGLH